MTPARAEKLRKVRAGLRALDTPTIDGMRAALSMLDAVDLRELRRAVEAEAASRVADRPAELAL